MLNPSPFTKLTATSCAWINSILQDAASGKFSFSIVTFATGLALHLVLTLNTEACKALVSQFSDTRMYLSGETHSASSNPEASRFDGSSNSNYLAAVPIPPSTLKTK